MVRPKIKKLKSKSTNCISFFHTLTHLVSITISQVIDDIPKFVDEIPLHETNSQTSTENAKKSDAIRKCDVYQYIFRTTRVKSTLVMIIAIMFAATPLIVADNVQQGSIKAHTYHSYIMATGGYFSFAIVLLTFIAAVASTAFSSWWLALWINAGDGVRDSI